MHSDNRDKSPELRQRWAGNCYECLAGSPHLTPTTQKGADPMTNLTPAQEKILNFARGQVRALRATATTARIATMLLPAEPLDVERTRKARRSERHQYEGASR